MDAMHRFVINVYYTDFPKEKPIKVVIENYGSNFEKSGNVFQPLLEAATKWIRKQEVAEGMLKDFEVKPKRPAYLKPRKTARTK